MFHETVIRVRYAETDAMGVAHHAAFLVWFEEARTGLCRAAGIVYRELEARGLMLPVVEILCRYRRPLRYDDEVVIQTTVMSLTRRNIRFRYQVRSEGLLYAEGQTYHVVIDSTTRRPTTFPADVLDVLQRWAAAT
jgi:acyl-CoA thioester hydrolase